MKLGGLLLLVSLIIVFANICCASSICDKTQEATLFTIFEVACSLPYHEWTSVVYRNESNDLIRYQKAKCEDSSGRTIGPRDKDGTLHITNTGVLVFNNITMNDSTNYQLEYLDCDGGSYDQYIDNFYISVHNAKKPTTASSEGSTSSSDSSTPVHNEEKPATATSESCTTSSYSAPSVHNEEEPVTASSESSTTSSQPNTSREKNHNWKGVIIIVAVIFVLCGLVSIFICGSKCKARQRKESDTADTDPNGYPLLTVNSLRNTQANVPDEQT